MLRITRTDGRATRQLRLEGKLIGPWVDEVAAMCGSAHEHAPLPHLDLEHVTFADARGIHLLRELVTRGARIHACSNYLAAVLRLEEDRP